MSITIANNTSPQLMFIEWAPNWKLFVKVCKPKTRSKLHNMLLILQTCSYLKPSGSSDIQKLKWAARCALRALCCTAALRRAARCVPGSVCALFAVGCALRAACCGLRAARCALRALCCAAALLRAARSVPGAICAVFAVGCTLLAAHDIAT